jgi:hypothetical protein
MDIVGVGKALLRPAFTASRAEVPASWCVLILGA